MAAGTVGANELGFESEGGRKDDSVYVSSTYVHGVPWLSVSRGMSVGVIKCATCRPHTARASLAG